MKKPRKNLCIVQGCTRAKTNLKHGLCAAHLLRWYRHGEVGTSVIRKQIKRMSYIESQTK